MLAQGSGWTISNGADPLGASGAGPTMGGLSAVAGSQPRQPDEWPEETLKAQAVVARSYALATRTDGPFDVYADVRSQVEANGRALTSGDAPRFAEWPETLDIEQSASLFRGYLQPFAAALPAWADAFEWAKQQAPRWLEGR